MNKENILLVFLCLLSQNIKAQKSPLMVYVKGGVFNMGSNEFGNDAMPVHKVNVSSYYMSKYDVTIEEYKLFCSNTGRKMNDTLNRDWEDNYPMVNVSMYDAMAYAEWLGSKNGKKYRLPTEAEWEYAARGGKKSKGYKFSGGLNMDSLGWYGNNSEGHPHPVGLKKPNELGLFDMSGNVMQWCSDWYSSDYYKHSSSVNPKGAISGMFNVCRGGCWYSDANSCSVSFRGDHHTTDSWYTFVGFRLVSPE